MTASKRRPLWSQLPRVVQARAQVLVQGQVISAQNCPGGFSPGFASRLHLAGGGRAFVKAMDADTWPVEADSLRAEAHVASALPRSVPAPMFLGWIDDGSWVILAFEDVVGAEPAQPWQLDELRRVVAAIEDISRATAPPASPTLPRDHPRLGGWAELARDPDHASQLAPYSPWAAAHLHQLVDLEAEGLAAAQGSSLVHFDLYAHNMLLTPDRVVFVDWPHARRGAPSLTS